jgi:hypothetical protein
MLVELCVGNKTMYDGLVNGIDGILKASTTYCDKTNIWIMFQNSKIRTLTRENIIIITTTTLNKNGTPIEPIIKDIRVDKFQSFIIISIQFPIQLVAPKTIHHSQGLSHMNWLLILVMLRKWVNAYHIVPHSNKRKIILLTPLQHENFYLDPRVHIELNRLKTIVTWIPFNSSI